MIKPIIGFDMDGTIFRSEPFEKAHESWFRVMAVLLNDDSLIELAAKKDYFPDVFRIMGRLTGLDPESLFDKAVMTAYARNLYQMLCIAEIKKRGRDAFFSEVIDEIIDLKQRFRIALITTAPEDMVFPALQVVGIKELFDYVYRSPINKEPSKIEILRKFVSDLGIPALYVGNEKNDAEACRELGIKFALAKWGKYDSSAENISDFSLAMPSQLVNAINSL